MKKILILLPILPNPDEASYISNSLKFLSKDYQLIFLDPLKNSINLTKSKNFIKNLKHIINDSLNNYDIFMGFSLGGVILQQSFDLFSAYNKKIVLYSTPSFCNQQLYEKLDNIKALVLKGLLSEAIKQKNSYVFYPFPSPTHTKNNYESKESSNRLLHGLEFILNIDSREILSKYPINYIHLI